MIPRYVGRDAADRALFAVRITNCMDPFCEKRGAHLHRYTIADDKILTADVLLSMPPEDFEEARIDLAKQYPHVYTPENARAALEEEAAGDDWKARAEDGRKVA